MSLETHIAGSEDRLLDSLHFGGKNSASYITERRQVTFAPSSASSWKPSGVRLCRFNLADMSGWLDGRTVRLFFTLTNLHATSALDPICDSPAGMFRRVRIIANGSSVIEDIEDYGRVSQMFTYLSPIRIVEWATLAKDGVRLRRCQHLATPCLPQISRQIRLGKWAWPFLAGF